MIKQISKKLAQQIVNTVKDVCGYDINVIDEFGTIFASTDEKRIGQYHEIGKQVAATNETIEVSEDDSYSGTKKGVNIPIFYNGLFIAVIGISGEPDEVRKYAYLAVRITMLLMREQEVEAFNRSKKEKMKYVMDALLSDQKVNREYLQLCLEEMNINLETDMRVIYIKINTRYNLMNLSLIEQRMLQLYEMMKCSFYVYYYPDEYVAVISDKCFEEGRSLLEQWATEYEELLTVTVGMRRPIFQIKKSYETAMIAAKSMGHKKKPFRLFDELDIGILLGGVENEIKQAYEQKTVSGLSEEDKEMLRVYYEEEMSLTGTCKRLFLHKNTLQYKLDKIASKTGYNPRKFQDAVVLYLGLNM